MMGEKNFNADDWYLLHYSPHSNTVLNLFFSPFDIVMGLLARSSSALLRGEPPSDKDREKCRECLELIEKLVTLSQVCLFMVAIAPFSMLTNATASVENGTSCGHGSCRSINSSPLLNIRSRPWSVGIHARLLSVPPQYSFQTHRCLKSRIT